MAWLAAHATEIAWGLHDATTEVIMPNAVHNRSPGQRVSRVSDPTGQSGAAAPLILRIRNFKSRTQSRNTGQRAGADRFTRFVNVAPFQDVDRPRRLRRCEVSFRDEI